jgi:polysaccharide pyruvyl transferase WcaK-like protein
VTRRTSRSRVGLFGLLGQGNFGNDGSLDAVLAFLSDRHPDAELDFLCSGPAEMTRRYDRPAVRLHWNRREYETARGPRDLIAKAAGKAVDAVRTLRWVRGHDAVIVPGMGVLESTLPLRPWGFPYSLFLVCAAGRLSRTKVALVGVGADRIADPATRYLVTRAARLASYRSYRDVLSRDAMTAMGVDTAADDVCPDLVFALPGPTAEMPSTGAVGLGVMDYHGGNEDRERADEIHTSYVDAVIRFAQWLVDNGHRIRMLIGDTADAPVAATVAAAVRAHRPDLEESWITTTPIASLGDLLCELEQVDTVVATRFHNVVCALKTARPTVSLGYAAKNDVLMTSMGLGDYCQSARAVDVDRLIEQFLDLHTRQVELRGTLRRQAAANAALLDDQFADLSAAVIPDETLTTHGKSA